MLVLDWDRRLEIESALHVQVLSPKQTLYGETVVILRLVDRASR